ncbi:MAG: dihydropteroate synthase [Desulfuromonadaceae bacterium]|nr:dihydropteroate synthase [Desulfuromonadaceae bacterium]
MERFTARALAISTPDQSRIELERIGADHAGVAMMAGKMLTRCIRINSLQCRQANILKQEMLGLGGDAAVARGTVACSIKSTDAILIGTDKQLNLLCGKLKSQPFGLPLLADLLTELLAGLGRPPERWITPRREFSLKRPLIMGILNLTPDSFSDGGLFDKPGCAIEHALKMEAEGADIIDIGGESTRPGARQVGADEEMGRIMPVIEQLCGKLSCAISVDTRKSVVARAAVSAGVEIINDVSGFNFDPEMAVVTADSGAAAVLMHARGKPDEMQRDTVYADLMSEIAGELQNSVSLALQAGVSRDRIAIDPGIGFGKDSSGNLEILRRLAELKSLGLPILIGTSRKSFIGNVLGQDTASERLYGTLATVALSVANGASILRVHDVHAMREAADMAQAVMQS